MTSGMTNSVGAVFQALERSKHRAYGAFLRANEEIRTLPSPIGEAADHAAMRITFEVEKNAIESTLRLVELTSRMSESEKLALVQASEADYVRYANGHIGLVDMMHSRLEIYRYILDPSDIVARAHAEHRTRMKASSGVTDQSED